MSSSSLSFIKVRIGDRHFESSMAHNLTNLVVIANCCRSTLVEFLNHLRCLLSSFNTHNTIFLVQATDSDIKEVDRGRNQILEFNLTKQPPHSMGECDF